MKKGKKNLMNQNKQILKNENCAKMYKMTNINLCYLKETLLKNENWRIKNTQNWRKCQLNCSTLIDNIKKQQQDFPEQSAE